METQEEGQDAITDLLIRHYGTDPRRYDTVTEESE